MEETLKATEQKMRYLCLVIAVLNLSCGAVLLPTLPEGYPPQNTDPLALNALTIISPDGAMGHACPVGNQILTAGHLAKKRDTLAAKGEMRKFSWETLAGGRGEAEGTLVDGYRDLGWLKLTEGAPGYYYSLGSTVRAGDKIRWVEFQKNSVLPQVEEAKVLHTLSGYIWFDKGPSLGASGSCLFDEEGDVVGVVVWSMRSLVGSGTRGAAVSLVPD